MKNNDNINKADKILSSIDSEALKSGIEKLGNISESESKKLKAQLASIDKKKVLDMFSSLSPSMVKEKLSNLDISKLSEITKNSEFMEKIKKDKK